MWYVYTMDCDSLVNKNEIMNFMDKWEELTETIE